MNCVRVEDHQRERSRETMMQEVRVAALQAALDAKIGGLRARAGDVVIVRVSDDNSCYVSRLYKMMHDMLPAGVRVVVMSDAASFELCPADRPTFPAAAMRDSSY